MHFLLYDYDDEKAMANVQISPNFLCNYTDNMHKADDIDDDGGGGDDKEKDDVHFDEEKEEDDDDDGGGDDW